MSFRPGQIMCCKQNKTISCIEPLSRLISLCIFLLNLHRLSLWMFPLSVNVRVDIFKLWTTFSLFSAALQMAKMIKPGSVYWEKYAFYHITGICTVVFFFFFLCACVCEYVWLVVVVLVVVILIESALKEMEQDSILCQIHRLGR